MRGEMYDWPINKDNLRTVTWDESYFKFCEFEEFLLEAPVVCSDFVACTFFEIECYRVLFTQANFMQCRFINCRFMGTTFTNTRFIECTFNNCSFIKDNLSADCKFKDTTAYACKIEGSEGFKATLA